MSALSDELAYMSLADLTARIRQRDMSPVEVVEAAIERICDRNVSLNAFVYCAFDEAVEKAREAERAVMAGEPLGLLHGAPSALKDLFSPHAGWIETFGGIPLFKDHRPTGTSVFAERVEQAGGVLLGKTNSPTLGFRGTCDNLLFGPTRNPFDPAKNSGGSSGGSAAAVADGLLPFAHGSDAGGSIRIPAAWCGVFGYKASYGRVPVVSRPDAFGSAMPFLFAGPITRTVADAALVMTAVGGYHPDDPFSVDSEVDYLGATKRDVSGIRIAYSRDCDVFPIDPQVTKVLDAAVLAFEEVGAHVEEVRLGINQPLQDLSDAWCQVNLLKSITFIEGFKRSGIDLPANHRDQLPSHFLTWIEKVYALSVSEIMHYQQVRTEVFDAIQAVFRSYALLLTPTVAIPPVDNADDRDTIGPIEVNGISVNPLIGWCPTFLINFSGHPAASIPAGLTEQGLPVGMQIVGRRLDDASVLAASAAFERLRPWYDTYEHCAARPL